MNPPSIVKSGKLTLTEYRTLHHWVQKQLGKPNECENCSTTIAKRFHWANLSGDYLQNVSDWARLCVLCHMLIDNRHNNGSALRGEYCKRGHKVSEVGLYYQQREHAVYSECRGCIRFVRRAYRAKYGRKPKLMEVN